MAKLTWLGQLQAKCNFRGKFAVVQAAAEAAAGIIFAHTQKRESRRAEQRTVRRQRERVGEAVEGGTAGVLQIECSRHFVEGIRLQPPRAA